MKTAYRKTLTTTSFDCVTPFRAYMPRAIVTDMTDWEYRRLESYLKTRYAEVYADCYENMIEVYKDDAVDWDDFVAGFRIVRKAFRAELKMQK